MPKCHCPASHIAASNEGDGLSTISILPSTFRGDRRGRDLFDSENNLEEGRSRVFGKYWPFCTSGRSSYEDKCEVNDKDMDREGTRTRRRSSAQGTIDPTRIVENDTKSVHSSQSGSSMTSDPVPPILKDSSSSSHIPSPHLYYGRPDSVWEHRLRRLPWHLINTPLICVGASFVPQAPASFVVSAGVVAFFFAFLVLRYHHEWWRRYTFVLAAALDAGSQICNMAIFVAFSLILRGTIKFPNWFGNDEVNVERCGVGDGYN